jgi:uroporphyrin-3 C-methyltransferase
MTESDPQMLLPAPYVAPARPSRLFLVLMLILVLITAAVAAGGVYLWWQVKGRDAQLQDLTRQLQESRQLTEDTERQVGQMAQNLSQQVEQKLGVARSQLEEGNRLLQQRVAELGLAHEELQQRLNGQQQRLAALSTTSREDWQLAEAEYLIKMANQRLLLERDAHNATALLRSADSLIQQASAGTGDAELFSVRKSLSRDLAALAQVVPVDKEGLYLRLHALADSLDQLPRVAPTRFAEPAAPEPSEDAETESVSWAGRLWGEIKAMAGRLDDYIRIDDVEAPAKPLVDTYVTQVAGLNLRLLLEQAQMAVLKADPVIYKHSLEQAGKLVAEYYLDSIPAQRLKDTLAELAEVDIAPPLPDISPTLGLLHDYLRQLHQARPAPRGQLAPAEGQS